MAEFYVYLLRRPDKEDPFESGKACPFYVGKGSNGRVNKHRKEALALLHKSGRKSLKIGIIHKLWKAGLDFEEDMVLTTQIEEEAFLLERQTIATYGRADLKTGILANLTDGGEGASGVVISEENRKKRSIRNLGNTYGKGKIKSDETRKKLSNAHKGKIRTEEHSRHISEAKKGISTATEETRKKMSEARKGRIFSDETRKKLSEALKGRERSEEHKKNLSKSLKGRIAPNKGGTSWLKGKHHSEETRKKIGEGNKGKYVSEETRLKLSAAFKGRNRIDGHWVNSDIMGKGV